VSSVTDIDGLRPTMASSSTEVGVDREARIALIRAGVQERLARNAAVPGKAVPAPRYDAVYAAGMEWLDSLAGEPIREGAIRLEFDDMEPKS
jgi:hypothetical protein